jgi:hypothetical protein
MNDFPMRDEARPQLFRVKSGYHDVSWVRGLVANYEGEPESVKSLISSAARYLVAIKFFSLGALGLGTMCYFFSFEPANWHVTISENSPVSNAELVVVPAMQEQPRVEASTRATQKSQSDRILEQVVPNGRRAKDNESAVAPAAEDQQPVFPEAARPRAPTFVVQ